MEALTLRDLVAQADVIARVRVGPRHSVQDATTRRIHTLTQVRVTAPMLGTQPNQELTVRTWGGQVGTLGMRVEGEAELVDSEDALIFLEVASRTTYRVLGMSQGIFHLTSTTDGEIATQLGGAALLALDENGVYQPSERALPGSTAAASLIRQVAELIGLLRARP